MYLISPDSNYSKETRVFYKEETYLVRDNGAVFRLPPTNGRIRPLDNKWTFGKVNHNSGYLEIGKAIIHRIVAFAFHGEPPTKNHVVDHIDTNRQNNRPENLRWVTKLENILLNPITLSRIIYSYGSLDNFFQDPNDPQYEKVDSSFDWMRTVSKEEAENCRINLQNWAEKSEIPKGGILGDWIYSKIEKPHFEPVFENPLDQSLTLNVLQQNWKTPTEFPLCPYEINLESLITYKNSLLENVVFSINQYGVSKVLERDLSNDKKTLYVLTYNPDETAIKKYALASVYIENEHFIHENMGSFFEKIGAEKQYSLIRGLIWNGGDSIDDYC